MPTVKASIESNILQNFTTFDNIITPSYLKKAPFRNFLIAVARSDGKLLNILKRAHLNEHVGKAIVSQLLELDLITLHESREAPLKQFPKQKLKKALRGYKIQPKIRFAHPFYHFWFGYIEPFRFELTRNNYDRFFEYFDKHAIRLTSLVFEQLSNDLIEMEFDTLSCGNYWDKNSEFDILAITKNEKLILGECKCKNKKICKNELSKLQYKAKLSHILPTQWVLFSRNGFSNELKKSKQSDLKLYDLNDFKLFLR